MGRGEGEAKAVGFRMQEAAGQGRADEDETKRESGGRWARSGPSGPFG